MVLTLARLAAGNVLRPVSGSGSELQNRLRAALTSWGLEPHTQPSPTRSSLKFQSPSVIGSLGDRNPSGGERRPGCSGSHPTPRTESSATFSAASDPKWVLTASGSSAGGMRVSHTQWKSCESTASQRGHNAPSGGGGETWDVLCVALCEFCNANNTPNTSNTLL